MAEHVLIVEAGVPVAGVQKTTICTFTVEGEEQNEGILLANPKVPKLVCPTCLLGRQKS